MYICVYVISHTSINLNYPFQAQEPLTTPGNNEFV